MNIGRAQRQDVNKETTIESVASDGVDDVYDKEKRIEV
jgi:hypothetical protein